MRRSSQLWGGIIVLLAVIAILAVRHFLLFQHPTAGKEESLNSPQFEEEEEEKSEKPSDWFVRQRAYPEQTINITAYRTATEQARRLRAAYPATDEVVWEEAGPNNIGGRITALASHPSIPSVIYAGAADGGVLKSTDGGTNWTPVFDTAGSLSIGAIAVDPSNPYIIWVGTGEANAAGDNYPGDGIYRTSNAGTSWEHMGLENSYHIGRIAIDPTNPDRLFAAATGALFTINPERGIYRTENGGLSWEQVLYLTDSTAAIDVVINPQNPQIVYAAMWERIRHLNQRNVGGVTSGIWRSTDGGDNWSLLSNGLPAPAPDVGRIGLTISPSNPSILYAIYADHPGYLMGVWKTTNGGDTWAQTGSPSSSIYSSYGWYFGNIYVDPVDPQKVFALGLYLYRSTNGGASWSNVNGSMHVDHHAFWINPGNPNQIWDGNDGGVYFTTTGGSPWSKCYDLHISQFYAMEIDFLNPYRLYGGTQDNGTLRTWTGNLDDWDMIYGGDGFYCVVDYTNSNIIFAEYQYGELAKSTNGGYSFNSCLSGVSSSDRRNWSTPVVMDPSDHNVLYYGTYRLYRTTNLAGNWTAISADLTDGYSGGNITYNTCTTIAVAPTNGQVIYVGTDDGNVWVTQNTGSTWVPIYASLPDRWVTRVAVSPQAENVAYVTLSGYRISEPLPHVFRTTDFGANWQDVSGNLPEAPVNVILEDPDNPQRLYVGTDVGVYVSENLGASWQPLGIDLPISSVMDMKLHDPTRTLVAGTHGRSMYKTNPDSLVSNPNVTVSLIPENPPIQIPASGGSFNFNIAASNGEAFPVTVDVWCDVTLPSGSTYGPVLGPVSVSLPGGITLNRDRSQSVPASAPAGNYQYNAYVGAYPGEIWDSDNFLFSKLPQGYRGLVTEWTNEGEPFSDEKAYATSNPGEETPLLQSHPNPFNQETTIRFTLSRASHVRLTIYDVRGREVEVLMDDYADVGEHGAVWRAGGLPTGLYFCQARGQNISAAEKIMLIK